MITVLKSGSKKIKTVTITRTTNAGNNIFLILLLFLYFLFKVSHRNIITANFATSDGWILKNNKFNHLLEPPISMLKLGINTIANSPIAIKTKKIEILE